jgi:hypothetical protein
MKTTISEIVLLPYAATTRNNYAIPCECVSKFKLAVSLGVNNCPEGQSLYGLETLVRNCPPAVLIF